MEIICGHYCLPPDTLTNADLELRFGKEVQDRVSSIVGVSSRRVGGCATQLGYYTALHVLESLELPRSSVGSVLFVSQTGRYRMPSNACVLHGCLGLREECAAFDIGLGCSGLVYAFQISKAVTPVGSYSLIVCSDTITKYLNPEWPGLTNIHGDGASCLLLYNGPCGYPTIKETVLYTKGSHANRLFLDSAPGSYKQMDGSAVAQFAIHDVVGSLRRFASKLGLDFDICRLIFHQANHQIVSGIYKALGVDPQNQFVFIENVGNTAAASTGITLVEAWRQGFLRAGPLIVVSFGNGLSWGCAYIDWGDVPALTGSVELKELAKVYRGYAASFTEGKHCAANSDGVKYEGGSPWILTSER